MNQTGVGETKGGVFDDLVEIFVAPSAVFERRRNGGYGTLVLVLMLLTLVITVATMGITAPFWDGQFDIAMKQAAANGQALPPEASGDTARSVGRWIAVITQVVMVPLFVWIGGLFVLLGAKVAGASISYRQGATLLALSSIPRLLSPIAMAVQGLLLPASAIQSVSSASLGPSRFVDPMELSPAILGLLSNFDLVIVWSFALLGIGISVVGRVSRMNGFLGTAIVFACVLALSLIPAALA